MSNDRDATCEQVLGMAARDESLSDDVFVVISRAIAGLDPFTGEPQVPVLPKRMHMRGWRKDFTSPVETGSDGRWYWRCPRKSCDAWAGPFCTEHEAIVDGRANHSVDDRPCNNAARRANAR